MTSHKIALLIQTLSRAELQSKLTYAYVTPVGYAFVMCVRKHCFEIPVVLVRRIKVVLFGGLDYLEINDIHFMIKIEFGQYRL